VGHLLWLIFTGEIGSWTPVDHADLHRCPLAPMMAVSASQIVPAAATHVDGPVHGGGSDGVFAIAITLLALEIGLPAGRRTTCQVTLLLPRLGGEDIGDSVMNGALVVSTSGVRFPVPARPHLIRHFARNCGAARIFPATA
jgi:hypothetical protein